MSAGEYPPGTPRILGDIFAALERRVDELEKRLQAAASGGSGVGLSGVAPAPTGGSVTYIGDNRGLGWFITAD